MLKEGGLEIGLFFMAFNWPGGDGSLCRGFAGKMWPSSGHPRKSVRQSELLLGCVCKQNMLMYREKDSQCKESSASGLVVWCGQCSAHRSILIS